MLWLCVMWGFPLGCILGLLLSDLPASADAKWALGVLSHPEWRLALHEHSSSSDSGHAIPLRLFYSSQFLPFSWCASLISRGSLLEESLAPKWPGNVLIADIFFINVVSEAFQSSVQPRPGARNIIFCIFVVGLLWAGVVPVELVEFQWGFVHCVWGNFLILPFTDLLFYQYLSHSNNVIFAFSAQHQLLVWKFCILLSTEERNGFLLAL